MRIAGVHLHQPPSPVRAANQQQRDGAVMWAEGSDGHDRLESRRKHSSCDSRQNRQGFQVGLESPQGQKMRQNASWCVITIH